MRLSSALYRILTVVFLITGSLSLTMAQKQGSSKGRSDIAEFIDNYAVADTSTEGDQENPYIVLHHKQYEDSVVLRWAPTTRALWFRGNKSGYVLTRYEYPLDLDSLSNDEQEMIVSRLSSISDPIKPYDSARWSSVFPTDDKYIIIAAGASAGSLEINADAVGFGLKAEQDESIYGFTLLSTDLSATAASGLGLRYVDKTVEKGRTYEYRVSLAESAEVIKTDSLMNVTYEGLDSTQVIEWISWLDQQEDGYVSFEGQLDPMLMSGVKTISREKSVELRWPIDLNSQYSAFFIERSSDNGRTFDTLTHNAYISESVVLIDSLGNDHSYFNYVDQVEENYIKYTYRITGLDGFGDRSEPATVQGMGRDLTPPTNPQMVSGTYKKTQERIRLDWRKPEISDDFSRFFLQYRNAPDTPWSTRSEQLSTTDTVYYHIPNPHEYENYFRLGIADTANNIAYSFPIFVNIPDTIPPPAPTQIVAEIDTTGQVKLTWEQDIPKGERLMGFRVFYANTKSHEFTQLTKAPIKRAKYNYEIPLKTLTDEIYYKIQAVDNNYNHSEFSEIIKGQKPDILPPVAPVLKSPRVNENYVALIWEPSSSKDVVSQEITRTRPDSELPPTKFQIKTGETTYYDSTANKGVVYQYTIAAIDDADLRSTESFPVRARVVDKKLMRKISSLEAKHNASRNFVELKWDYDQAGDYRFIIYRNFENDKVKRYKSVAASTTTFKDDIQDAGTYYYAIKVVEKSGKKSLLSDVISVNAR